MRAALAGLGEWRPEEIRTNDAWPEALVASFRARASGDADDTLVEIPSDPDDALTLASLAAEARDPFLGTTARRVAGGTSAADAETRAARAALQDARVEAASVDVVMSYALVPDRVAQASAPKIAASLGCGRARAMGVELGCATALAQLELACSLIEAGRAHVVLCTQSHLVSRAVAMSHPVSPNLGDLATAFVVVAVERARPVLVHAVTDGEYHEAVVWARGRDDASDKPWWQEGGAFYAGTRDPLRAKRLMRDTVRFARQTIDELAERARLDRRDVAVMASVQPRGWIPSAIAERTGLAGRSVDTFRELAHVGGCGPVANLLEARRRGLAPSGARAVLYGQGAGFTRAAALVTMP